ncbi:hypothetical protein PVL29_013233 [Vitis rotundifolia]|uniref:Uncharacterized protein n=1 Tax=Vitis rotundifolia TaxID=103349 RepID=A0AA39DNB3_VITRO|nr:hypothetical protein PVL29_013233 [Vitis rotundifolia]
MEALSSLIAKAEQGGFIRGFKIEGRGEIENQVSHLLFADDTFLLCEDDVEQLNIWKWIIMCFELVSGLKINLQKSEVIPMGETMGVNRATSLFGCKVGKLPTSYLVLPLGAPNKYCGVWDSIEERFKKKLAVWKKHYLSKGGRLVFLKRTLSNLLIYFMPLFDIPRKVRIRLQRIQRDFLWGDLGDRSKIHLVKWSDVCKAKNFGGLGIRRLHSLNQALLGLAMEILC